jgi:hypothetical protein
MATLEHPYKAEVAALREIILGVSDDITETIKWNAPTFSYKGYIASFNLHSKLGRQVSRIPLRPRCRCVLQGLGEGR